MERDMADTERKSLMERQKADQSFRASQAKEQNTFTAGQNEMDRAQEDKSFGLEEQRFAEEQKFNAMTLKNAEDERAISMLNAEMTTLGIKSTMAHTKAQREISDEFSPEIDDLRAKFGEYGDIMTATAAFMDQNSREMITSAEGRKYWIKEYGTYLETKSKAAGTYAAQFANNLAEDINVSSARDKHKTTSLAGLLAGAIGLDGGIAAGTPTPDAGRMMAGAVASRMESPNLYSELFDAKSGDLNVGNLVDTAFRGTDLGPGAAKVVKDWVTSAGASAKASAPGGVKIDDAALDRLRENVAQSFQGVQEAIKSGDLNQEAAIGFINMLTDTATGLSSSSTAEGLSAQDKLNRTLLARQLDTLGGTLRSSSVRTPEGFMPFQGVWETADIKRVEKYLNDIVNGREAAVSDMEELMGFDNDPMEESLKSIVDEAKNIRSKQDKYRNTEGAQRLLAKTLSEKEASQKKASGNKTLDIDEDTSRQLLEITNRLSTIGGS